MRNVTPWQAGPRALPGLGIPEKASRSGAVTGMAGKVSWGGKGHRFNPGGQQKFNPVQPSELQLPGPVKPRVPAFPLLDLTQYRPFFSFV